jgi:PASTA domain
VLTDRQSHWALFPPWVEDGKEHPLAVASPQEPSTHTVPFNSLDVRPGNRKTPTDERNSDPRIVYHDDGSALQDHGYYRSRHNASKGCGERNTSQRSPCTEHQPHRDDHGQNDNAEAPVLRTSNEFHKHHLSTGPVALARIITRRVPPKTGYALPRPSHRGGFCGYVSGKVGTPPVPLIAMGRRWWSGVVVGFAAAILFGGGILVGLTVAHRSPTALSQQNHDEAMRSGFLDAHVVPALIGEPLPVASNSLTQAGLVGSVSGPPPCCNGEVLVSGQSPRAGTNVKDGATVFFTLTVKHR